MRRYLVFALLFAGFGLTLPAHSQMIDLCDLANGSGALGAHSVQTPLSILADVIGRAGFQLDDFTRVQTKDERVRGNALTETCREPACNCIFYDPAYLPTDPSATTEHWSANFVLAHEAGHIIKAMAFLPRKKREAAADDWAGWALAMQRPPIPIEAVMAGVDHVANSENSVNPEEDTDNYYGRSHRRMDALGGYNRALVENQSVKPEDAPQPCGWDGTKQSVADGFAVSFAAPLLGLYLKTDGAAGTPLKLEMVASCGSKTPPDVPTDFNRDLRGTCLLSSQKVGTQLTWDLVGLCKP
jgi:hypothetical protein